MNEVGESTFAGTQGDRVGDIDGFRRRPKGVTAGGDVDAGTAFQAGRKQPAVGERDPAKSITRSGLLCTDEAGRVKTVEIGLDDRRVDAREEISLEQGQCCDSVDLAGEAAFGVSNFSCFAD